VRGGLLVAGDHQVDPRALVAALIEGCRRAGVRFVAERVRELRLIHGLVAAGAWSPTLLVSNIPVRPVKGQILRLRGGRVERKFRGARYTSFPARGRVVVGATVEERGFDRRSPPARARVLRAAIELVPTWPNWSWSRPARACAPRPRRQPADHHPATAT